MKKLAAIFTVGLLVAAVAAAGCSKPKLTPEQAKQQAKQGMDLVHAGKFAEANKVLEQAAQSEGTDAKTFFLLGVSRYQKKDYAGAIQAYDKAIALDAKMASAYQAKANTYRDQKNMKDAEKWYRKAWEVDPAFLDAYTELSLQFALANKMPEAYAVLEEGLKQNPDAVSLKLLLASYYAQTGKKDEARNIYEAILKADPANPDAKQALAKLN